MHAETIAWETPLMSRKFDLKANGQQLEEDVISPAIKAIVSETINKRLMLLNLVDRNKLRIGEPKEGWDSALRFTDEMERVMPYRVVPSPIGAGYEANPDFNKWGLIVFSRDSPEGSHSFEAKRKTVRTDKGQKIMVWVTVTIPDESVFQIEWIRLDKPQLLGHQDLGDDRGLHAVYK